MIGSLIIHPMPKVTVVRFLADFKKRNAERKGGKKEEIKSKKLMEENLDALRGRGEAEK